ncbi:acetyl-CoA carboxylase biotin carboxyl carrier protein subunit [Bacillaceae bacterium SAS-127]|nr:acetyl-CoA carboxylase biotin carboxyl carrier protein subunit [Bacillaceae bacterium SAS-127]
MKVMAPMSGSVWKIQVSEGDQVRAGDPMIILESMKMEIPIESTLNGQIVHIHVSEGDFIQENDVVAEIENDS